MGRISTLIITITLALGGAAPALAAGGGMAGGTGGFPGPTGAAAPTAEELMATYNEGVAAVDAKDWKTAIGKFQTVTQYVPGNADAWNYLAYSSRKAGNAKRSESAYKKALKIDPNHPRANEYYGELLVELNRVPEAEQRLAVLQACCASDPVTAELAAFIAQGKAAGAAPRPHGGY